MNQQNTDSVMQCGASTMRQMNNGFYQERPSVKTPDCSPRALQQPSQAGSCCFVALRTFIVRGLADTVSWTACRIELLQFGTRCAIAFDQPNWRHREHTTAQPAPAASRLTFGGKVCSLV
eukprot:1142338-Pelagomonas_calceolata.AAC.7